MFVCILVPHLVWFFFLISGFTYDVTHPSVFKEKVVFQAHYHQTELCISRDLAYFRYQIILGTTVLRATIFITIY